MKILYNNIVYDSTITSSSEETNYEWDEALNDIRLTHTGRFTGDSSEWLKFAFDTVQTIDYVAILNHNITEDATITIEGNNTDAWGAPSFSETVSETEGNFYSTKRVANQIFQDVTNSFSGTSPTDYLQNGTNNYAYYTANPTKFQNGSVYESESLDLVSSSMVEWKSYGSVYVQFRDSIDGSSWGDWTTAVNANTTEKRAKVYRYMQIRVLFIYATWDDTTSYFELVSPTPEIKDIIIKNLTEAAYKYWRITIADSSNSDTYIEIGNVFLCDSLTMPGMDVNKIIAKKTNSEYSKNADGQIFSNPRRQLKYAEIPFTGVIESDKSDVETFVDTVDITDTWIMLIWEDDLIIEPPIYCNLTEIPVYSKEVRDYVSWTFTIKFEECG